MATITFYKDLPLDFTPHPVSGDVRPITNEVAIRRAIKNLILTPVGSKPFNPDYGTDVGNFLFSTPDGLTELGFRESIIEAINRFEPRAIVDSVNFNYENNDVQIIVSYTIRNLGQRDRVTTTITRTA